jgi:hypothetical protein
MTFSIAGAIVSLAVLAPNLLLLVAPPRDGIRTVDAGPLFTVLERVGQVACLVTPALTGSALTGSAVAADWWLAPVAIAVGGYLALWGRYLAVRRFDVLYRSLGPLPIPMAVLPVVAFLAAGAWLQSWWIVASAVVLAAGHLPNSWATRAALARSAG